MLWQSGVHNESFSVRVTIVITTSWQNVCAVSVCICPLLCASLRVVSPLFVVSVQVSGGVFVLGPRKVSQVAAHSRVVKQICARTCAPRQLLQ